MEVQVPQEARHKMLDYVCEKLRFVVDTLPEKWKHILSGLELLSEIVKIEPDTMISQLLFEVDISLVIIILQTEVKKFALFALVSE
jgi:hypothetical protein